jgi:hypothetical protein
MSSLNSFFTSELLHPLSTPFLFSIVYTLFALTLRLVILLIPITRGRDIMTGNDVIMIGSETNHVSSTYQLIHIRMIGPAYPACKRL